MLIPVYQNIEEKVLLKIFFPASLGIGRYLTIKITRKMPDILFMFNRAATPFSDYPPSYSSTWTSRAYSPLHGGSGSSSAYSGPETRTRTASGKNKNIQVPVKYV